MSERHCPDGLFPLGSDSSRKSSDEAYTPRWVFDAMGLEFDLDVAAPVGGPWHVPTKNYYTVADDGLASPWSGLVWCNPPYSGMSPWVDRYVEHDRAVLMGLALNRCQWLARAIKASDAVALLGNVGFSTPNGAPPPRFRQVVFVAFRGVGVEPAERLATADPYGAVLYGKEAA